MSTETDVANFALGHLGEGILPDLLGTDKATNTVNLWMDHARLRVLRMAAWTKAIKRDTLTVDGTAPEYGFGFRFALPADFVRMVNIGNSYGPEWTIEGEYILSYIEDDLEIRYVYDLTDFTVMYEDMIAAIALSLAYDMAPSLTQSIKRREEMWTAMLSAIAAAKNIDTTSTTPQGFQPGSWIVSRGGGYAGW